MFHYSDGDGVFSAQAAQFTASGMEVDAGIHGKKGIINDLND